MALSDDESVAGVDISSSFPAAIRPAVTAIAPIIPSTRLAPAAPFAVQVDDEQVSIPYRIYNDEPSLAAVRRLSAVQQLVLASLYTRHHNGYVRHRHLEAIVGHAETWVAPFVVQLLGEYVVQIALAIGQGLADLDVPRTATRRVYGRFAANNPEFIALTYQRAASYWDCYYRSLFADRRTYPSFPILTSIRTAAAEPGAATG